MVFTTGIDQWVFPLTKGQYDTLGPARKGKEREGEWRGVFLEPPRVTGVVPRTSNLGDDHSPAPSEYTGAYGYKVNSATAGRQTDSSKLPHRLHRVCLPSAAGRGRDADRERGGRQEPPPASGDGSHIPAASNPYASEDEDET